MGLHESPLQHHNIESKKIDATWLDYLGDCGGEKVIDNSVHTKIVFNDKYENNVINWSGYFAEVKIRQQGIFWFSGKELNILVKMDPSESTIFADLVLTVPAPIYSQSKSMFDSLRKGTGISFEGTMLNMGNEFKMHHVRALNV